MKNTYLITGASSDVGVLLVKTLLEKYKKQDLFFLQGFGDLEPLLHMQNEYPLQIQTFDIDLTNPVSRMAFLDEVQQIAGCPTHIIHLPALRVVNTNFKNFDEDRFHLDLQVQVLSAAAVCRRFLPLMSKAKFGRVLFMLTSYVLNVPPKYTASYIMAKEALWGLAKSLAADYAPHGITVNSVAPSMMETKFLDDTPSLIIEASAQANPMHRNARPDDVVPAMVFLLSEEARFITGAVLPITGGDAF